MFALGSILLLALPHLQIAAQQAARPIAAPGEDALRPEEIWTTVLAGHVFDAAGRPAEGALVFTSAGGAAVCDENGAYRFAIDVPLDARELRLTAALGSGNEHGFAGTLVDLRLLPPAIDVEPLSIALGATCQPDWLPTFGAFPGVNSSVYAMAVYDDGNGPDLYVGGDFQTAGAVYAPGVARWDGAQWTALDAPILGPVYALEVFDDGSGAQLYAGGDFFDFITPGAPNYIARWDGQAWKSLGSGANAPVRALAVFDSGGGPELHVGGEFTVVGGVLAQRVARWNGTGWSPLGSGVVGTVRAMAVHGDSTGTALYVGGDVAQAGGVSVNRLARWSGSAWSALGAGVNDTVYALASFESGDVAGKRLFAGGNFTQASGATANGLAVWNPASATWSAPLPLGAGSRVLALEPLSGPSGSWLAIARNGAASSDLLRWKGDTSYLPTIHVDGGLFAAQHFDDGSSNGMRTYAGGNFLSVQQPGTFEPTGAGSVFVADFGTASHLGTGLDNVVSALAVHDDGSGGGPALFVAGRFVNQGLGTAKWDGDAWVDVPPLPAFGGVRALLSFDGPAGRELVAGGGFPSAGGVTSANVARFSNGAWSGMGGGTNGEVRALAAWNGPTTSALDVLYAGGSFTTANGLPASRLAAWNGSTWASVGGGANGQVNALAVFDDGSGEALYVAGSFTAVGGGLPANRIARWNGSSWSTLGSGMNNVVSSLCVFDDGLGPKLYAGGRFTTAGGTTVNCIAFWKGSAWSPLGTGFSANGSVDVTELEVFDDGSGGGKALFAAGSFASVDGLAAYGIARWSGSAWSALGAGVAGPYVDDLAAFGDALYLGGGFTISPGGDSMLARWGGCDPGPTACTPTLVGPKGLSAIQCGTVNGAYQITSDGSLGTGTWSLSYGPGFPSSDGWSAVLTNTTNATTTLSWKTQGTSTIGLWPLLLTWTGTCNGLPVQWTFSIPCKLKQACPPEPDFTPYCFGDGVSNACPCGNTGQSGAGCANSTGQGAVLSASGTASVSAHDLVLELSHAVPGRACIFYQGSGSSGSAAFLPGDGLMCLGGTVVKLQQVNANGLGAASTTVDIATKGGVLAGETRYYQVWYRDSLASPCATAKNTSNGLEVTWVP